MNSTNLFISAAVVVNTVMISLLIRKKLKTRKRQRKVWSKKWLEQRRGRGVLNLLNKELSIEDPVMYKNFLRLNNTQFEQILSLVEKDICKQDTIMRECVSAQNRLEVTLRFLATGNSYRDLMFSTRIHESTISRFVPEVCSAIYKNLKGNYLQTPKTVEGWTTIAEDFYKLWHFPNCLGALDGRHIQFRAPASDGSYYFNYKGYHSIVLLGMCDAKYKFTYVNVGVNGRISDGGVFQQTALSKAMENPSNPLNFPPDRALPGRTMYAPFVIIADDAFPLSKHLLKPYTLRGITHDCKIFNYRLSRARRMIESCFGILANRFRILLNPINLSPEKVEVIVLACVALHNYLAETNDSNYLENVTEEIFENVLVRIGQQGGNNSTKVARDIRDEFKTFFKTSGAVSWQEAAIQKHNL